MNHSSIPSNIVVKVVGLLLLLMFGCKNDPTSSITNQTGSDFGTYDISKYMPLSVGNRWIYEYDNSSEHAVLDRRMKDSLHDSHQLLLFSYTEDVLVTTPPLSLPIAGYYGYQGGTLYYVDSRGPDISPRLPSLASPITIGHMWWTDAMGYRDSFQVIGVTLDSVNSQSIDTIVSVRRWNEGLVDTTWFGRTMGILKEASHRGSSVTTRQLRSFSPTP